MRTMTAVMMLAAMAAVALAQDPNRNRMNDPAPEARIELRESPFIPAIGNRMNVQYGKTEAAELTGGLNPNENRMNYRMARHAPKAQPKEQKPVDLYPQP